MKRLFSILFHIGALIISIPLAILIVNSAAFLFTAGIAIVLIVNSAAFLFTAGIAIVLTLLIVDSIKN